MSEQILSMLTIFGIMKNSFKNGKFTCKKYLLNAYLYIFLSLLLVSLSVKLFDEYKIPSLRNFNSHFKFFGFLLLSIILLITVMSWPTDNLVGKHALWLLWIALMGYTLYPLFQINKNLFTMVKYQALLAMVIITLFSLKNPNLISISWGTTLFALLIGLIVVQLFSLFIPGLYTTRLHYIISYASFLLFTFFMMYDTKRLIIKAKQCVKADYINASMSIVLDGINIFTDLFSIQEM